MVSRAEEAMKNRQQQWSNNSSSKGKVSSSTSPSSYQVFQKQITQCNKGKSPRFKRSSSDIGNDGASSAILFLACIACAPSHA
ncbi:hypothetical protein MLD38_032691 [Melastoma candidum]|uniref:Uncharacterized protein n=1 Tax=Melastoma candidum TaxID=119954 RepID=A0ACB9M4R0_9MYRT|nr:hypothetical protein MLD38_032691 [Melastoma candidum]